MNLSEDEIIQKYAKNCGHCSRNTLLTYEYELTSETCGYNVTKRKHGLSKFQGKKINVIKRFKNAEQKTFCFCVNVCQIYVGNECNKIFEVLSTLKNKKQK